MLRMPASTLLDADEQWNETGRMAVHGTGFDFRTPRAIGAHQLDHTFTDLEQDATGRVAASVVLPGGDEVTLWAGGSCHWLVVYTADTLVGPSRRSSLAIEPYTAPANALRTGTDLQVLAKGERFELTWGLDPSWLASSERHLDTTRGESR